ncbi:CGNR zinc finger domain-containing protein [Branchiibius cervicis]|uniref:CGNR zinc finger domain-containing protein n=1 Tax=Branchiibius cervicis TaxID=908252 RepID=A0ABW2AXU3_9MICO
MNDRNIDDATAATSTDQSRFPLAGGAPWLNLIATVGRAYSAAPIERLATTADLDEWLVANGLQAPPSNDRDLSVAYDLRAACRTISEAIVSATTPPSAAIRTIASDARHVSFTAYPQGARWDTARDALGSVALTALLSLTGPERAMLAQCHDPECGWVFLDPSGRRHWCPSRSCGTRTRVRQHRARSKIEPTAASGTQ